MCVFFLLFGYGELLSLRSNPALLNELQIVVYVLFVVMRIAESLDCPNARDCSWIIRKP